MNRFAPGTFTPDPRPATVQKMLAAQFGLELKLLLRNGEQLLLTMFIPITLLVGLTLLPFGSFGPNRAATFVPAIMSLAVISTAFTGQAIAVAFDRRYGACDGIDTSPVSPRPRARYALAPLRAARSGTGAATAGRTPISACPR